MPNQKKRSHELKYKDDDMLRSAHVHEVLSENSGYSVSLTGIPTLIKYRIARGAKIKVQEISPNLKLYRYGDIKNIIVTPHVGRKPAANPSAVALRQRDFKARLLLVDQGIYHRCPECNSRIVESPDKEELCKICQKRREKAAALAADGSPDPGGAAE